ncbi:hypothetical protein FHS39_003849 [Streptomyces olivoverticillatus]|uniref:LysM domain-containing protein n=1 Tax=Streptomyces olivoverticillatus TaxID=66427 RepID=A0A7W7LSC2_9ACTN|nr:hypothetical protein [Streptomyces olivoverticillatus]
MPLLGATGAVAADTGTWDQVAQCESGGMWSANSGNGYFGGLQLTQEMWDQNGGSAYAPRPDLASRSQQIAIAEKILDGKGPGTWSSCAAGPGLSKGSAAPEVDPGRATPEPQPSHTDEPEHTTPATPAHGGTTPSTPHAGSDKPAPGKSEAPGTATPSPSAPGASEQPGSGKHRKDPSADPTDPASPSATPTDIPSGLPSGTPSAGQSAPQDAQTPGDAGTTGGAGKHRADPSRSPSDGRASRDGGNARTDKPLGGDYTVRPGDNLSVIAQEHSVEGGWSSLYQKNEKVVGTDPDLIQPGQRLELHK